MKHTERSRHYIHTIQYIIHRLLYISTISTMERSKAGREAGRTSERASEQERAPEPSRVGLPSTKHIAYHRSKRIIASEVTQASSNIGTAINDSSLVGNAFHKSRSVSNRPFLLLLCVFLHGRYFYHFTFDPSVFLYIFSVHSLTHCSFLQIASSSSSSSSLFSFSLSSSFSYLDVCNFFFKSRLSFYLDFILCLYIIFFYLMDMKFHNLFWKKN